VWGSTFLAIAIAVQTLPAFLSAGLRFLLAGLLLGLWLVARHRREALRVDRGQLGGAALVGVLLLASGNGLVVLAERTVPSGLAALIIAAVPLWIVVFRSIAGDRIPASIIGGALVGFMGVAFLVVPRGASGEVDPFGLLILVAASFSWALGTFATPRLRMPRDPLASTALQMLAGGAFLLVAALVRGELTGADPSTFSTASLLAMAYLVVFGSLVAFSAYTWLLQHAPVSVVATYAYVNPVIAVLLGSVFLSEVVTPSMLIGAVIILAAVAFIVSRSATRSS
jgi:drug/metabolite transporter (DMT)-like permease